MTAMERLIRQGKGHPVRGGFLHRRLGRRTGEGPEHCGPHRHDKDAKEGRKQRLAPCANLWLGLGPSFYRYPWLHRHLIDAYRFGDILTVCSPENSYPNGSLVSMCSKAVLEMQIPRGQRGTPAAPRIHPSP